MMMIGIFNHLGVDLVRTRSKITVPIIEIPVAAVLYSTHNQSVTEPWREQKKWLLSLYT